MAEHADLVAEMQHLEKLNTEERLKMAKKRRSQQLKKWSQREKEYSNSHKRKKADTTQANSDSSTKETSTTKSTKKNGYKIHFVPSVMLLEAATRNDIDEVKRLLMLGVSPDSTNEDGLTALHQCCIDNCEDMMRLLIEFGANVNAKDSEQWTPLHAAATCGHLHLIRLLIEKDADLLAVNADGNMPYDICEDEQTLDYIEAEMAKRGITQELIDQIRIQTEIQMLNDMKDLLNNGYDINYRDEQGATPLHIASANGYMSVIEFLVDNNASIDECDIDMWQPIHAAACWGHIDVVEFLVQNGADLEAKTKNGETPYDICEDPDLKNRILQLKTEIDAKKAVSSTRLRRSHSTNTRSHSIRRTSIREKSQIAKREAMEEARIWQGKSIEPVDAKAIDIDLDSDSNQFYNDFNRKLMTESPIDLNSIKVKVDTTNMGDNSNNNQNTNNYNDDKNHYYHEEMNGDQFHQYPKSSTTVNHGAFSPNNDNNINSTRISVVSVTNNQSSNQSSENQYQHHQQQPYLSSNVPAMIESNGRKDVTDSSNSGYQASMYPDNLALSYSTTNANVVTLIDLKKQRSEKHRNNMMMNNNIYADRIKSSNFQMNDNAGNIPSMNHHHMSYQNHPVNSSGNQNPNLNQNQASSQNMLKYSSPASIDQVMFGDSPNAVRKKFRGNPSELIGDDGEKRGCCIIS